MSNPVKKKLGKFLAAAAEAHKADPSGGLVAAPGESFAIPAPHVVDLSPIRAAAERSGLSAPRIESAGDGYIVTCGPHVPPFVGATVAEIVAKIDGYNCKYCGSGGGHIPNCCRPR